MPAGASKSQEEPGGPRRTQEEPGRNQEGGLRRSQEEQGEARRTQEGSPEEPGGAREDPGGPREEPAGACWSFPVPSCPEGLPWLMPPPCLLSALPGSFPGYFPGSFSKLGQMARKPGHCKGRSPIVPRCARPKPGARMARARMAKARARATAGSFGARESIWLTADQGNFTPPFACCILGS